MWTRAPIGAEHVDAGTATLAPDSRHIVAFRSSNTTFRAADKFSEYIVAGVRVGVAGCRPGSGIDSVRTLPLLRLPGEQRHDLDRRTGRDTEKAVGRRLVGEPDRR